MTDQDVNHSDGKTTVARRHRMPEYRWRAGLIAMAGKCRPRAVARLLGPPRRRIGAGLCLTLGIGLAVLAAIQMGDGSGSARMRVKVNDPLPPIEVDASGVAVDLNQHAAGRRCAIVFYSPSCGTCRDVLPALQPFPSGLQLIMISESPERKEDEFQGFGDADFFYDRRQLLSRLFAIPLLPVILLVDEEGIIREGMIGSHGRDGIQRKLKQFADRENETAAGLFENSAGLRAAAGLPLTSPE